MGDALDTAELGARYFDDGGRISMVTEVRYRERALGVTLDARRVLRIWYSAAGGGFAVGDLADLEQHRDL